MRLHLFAVSWSWQRYYSPIPRVCSWLITNWALSQHKINRTGSSITGEHGMKQRKTHYQIFSFLRKTTPQIRRIKKRKEVVYLVIKKICCCCCCSCCCFLLLISRILLNLPSIQIIDRRCPLCWQNTFSIYPFIHPSIHLSMNPSKHL